MNFVYILIYLVLISHTIRFSVVDFLIEFSSDLHSACVQAAFDNVRSFESLQALVCGKNFSDPAQSNLLIASGLIHLFVVSASHLRILQKIIFYLLCNRYFSLTKFLQTGVFSLLFLYCAVCKFNPPILRSFAALITLALLEKKNLKWKAENLILVTGLICLILSPAWINSLSLQMSWIAALTLSVISYFFTQANIFFKSSIFYFQYLATFNFIGIPQPASIGVSTVFTKFLEYVLFPLALAVYLFPFLGSVFDFLIVSLNAILSKLELTVIFRPYDSEKMIFINWVLIFSLHLFLNDATKRLQPCRN
ncbi:MAG: ComEC/Rec2 family competence protein [Bdellovibrionota bacterium]